ncbi:MAG: hypothetical protein JWM36_2625 [Hyphomicrobiales bacterium]|nr:hypothetical protein [Hyphomicrobiales bacterium]
MVEYLTRDRIRLAGGTLNEQASVLRKAEQRSPSGSTFLSHSSKDSDLLPGVIRILEDHGAVVYVDKKDESLPPYTSPETADLLRSRIRSCHRFIMLTTPNSKDSRWVPWELGLSDGFKNAAHTVILPGPDKATETKWAEQEYLGVYDRIVYGPLQGHSSSVYMVWNRKSNTATELSLWLKT